LNSTSNKHLNTLINTFCLPIYLAVVGKTELEISFP
jgi:hypothetical protein